MSSESDGSYESSEPSTNKIPLTDQSEGLYVRLLVTDIFWFRLFVCRSSGSDMSTSESSAMAAELRAAHENLGLGRSAKKKQSESNSSVSSSDSAPARPASTPKAAATPSSTPKAMSKPAMSKPAMSKPAPKSTPSATPRSRSEPVRNPGSSQHPTCRMLCVWAHVRSVLT